MKYYIYCRVSSEREDRQVLGLPSQKKELIQYAEKHGLDVVKIFSEKKSAYKKGRVEFEKMITGLEAGEADAILVYHLTRVARNSYDGGRVIYMIDDKEIKELRTPEKIYTNCSDDKFLMQIHFAMSKKSSDDNSQFVKRDMKAKLKKCEVPGQVPLGYLNVSPNGSIAGRAFDHKKQAILNAVAEDRVLKRVEQDPVIAPLLRKLFDLALVGNLSLNELCEEAFKLGIVGRKSGKKLAKSSVDRILRNIFYYGDFKYDGAVWEGDYDPIITKAEHERLQQILDGASRPKSKKRDYTFSQIVKCGHCNKRFMSGDTQKGTQYYRCTGVHKGICENRDHFPESWMSEETQKAIETIELSDEMANFMIRKLEKEVKNEGDLEEKSRKKNQSQINKIKTARRTLREKWLSASNIDGVLISDEEYLEQKNIYEANLNEVESIYTDKTASHDDWISKAERLFEFARNLSRTFEDASYRDKRAILILMSTNYILKGSKVNKDARIEIELDPILQSLVKYKNYLSRTSKKPFPVRAEADLGTRSEEWRD